MPLSEMSGHDDEYLWSGKGCAEWILILVCNVGPPELTVSQTRVSSPGVMARLLLFEPNLYLLSKLKAPVGVRLFRSSCTLSLIFH